MTTLFVTFDRKLRHAHGYTFLSCTWISTIRAIQNILLWVKHTFGALFREEIEQVVAQVK